MKTLSTQIAAIALAVVAVSQPLYSQAPRPAKSVLQQLQEMKAANQKLLEQQAATLLKLEEMAKESGQLRILVRRT